MCFIACTLCPRHSFPACSSSLFAVCKLCSARSTSAGLSLRGLENKVPDGDIIIITENRTKVAIFINSLFCSVCQTTHAYPSVHDFTLTLAGAKSTASGANMEAGVGIRDVAICLLTLLIAWSSSICCGEAEMLSRAKSIAGPLWVRANLIAPKPGIEVTARGRIGFVALPTTRSMRAGVFHGRAAPAFVVVARFRMNFYRERIYPHLISVLGNSKPVADIRGRSCHWQ
jgi:hypothetical protein